MKKINLFQDAKNKIINSCNKMQTSTTEEKTGTLEGEPSSNTETLYILGAVYGLMNVTEDVKRLVTNNQLAVYASNKNKTTRQKDVKKTLVVVYKYGIDAYAAGVAFVEEDKRLVITQNTREWYFHEFNLRPNKLTIFGAVYGLEDVTTSSRNLISHHELVVDVNNKTFGDTWPSFDFLYVHTNIRIHMTLRMFFFLKKKDVKKSLVVVYGYDMSMTTSHVACAGEWEGTEELEITPLSKWTLHELTVQERDNLIILGAAYGLSNVTDKVTRLVSNNQLTVSASNQVFGDCWCNVKKTLVVVYKYGVNATSVGIAIVEEEKKMIITRNSREWTHNKFQLQPDTYIIFGAAYGVADVTTKTQSLLSNSQRTVVANNKIFGDSWPGILSSFFTYLCFSLDYTTLFITHNKYRSEKEFGRRLCFWWIHSD
ncbi:hypothetical protein RFI_05889 [Reticulomyxa filosa]|uniref:Uncharacterized protein n=1 Tax=Reticulomyxa filosa TaxID=46433 RepID=X6P109_RETFI|nr:hypothetical protein RFI_05889 [Reticulomyxa filosa]|eukprot:ETO31232.1 hypothetical protein RFI_05889 [Reticulomyxa filosa]